MTAAELSTTPEVKVWSPQRKTPADAESVKDVYQRFIDSRDVQYAKFEKEYLKKLTEEDRRKMNDALGEVGMKVDFKTCKVYYLKDFKPMDLNYDLCYVRHGKTEGNTEPRIFQGFCDYWENQLNETGKQQAVEAAEKMEKELSKYRPDLILCSPLGRAIETGQAFFKNHPEIPCRVAHSAREQQFGSWDNAQLRFMSPSDVCHLFYIDQNALVKAETPHINGQGEAFPSENFVDLIMRQTQFLREVNEQPEIIKANKDGKRAKVLVYGHSMAGAAVSMLLGHGKKTDDQGALGFDGKYIMPNATPTLLLAKKPDHL